jgi:pyridoxamine 5'-phosphate oxidase
MISILIFSLRRGRGKLQYLFRANRLLPPWNFVNWRVASKPLSEKTFHSDPIRQFHRWFRAAGRAGITEPNAMALATATGNAEPSVRMVLLKDVNAGGFVFFSNYDSRKALELRANPRAGLVFYWRELNRQVRVTGRVAKLSARESSAYFSTRPVGSRFAAIASRQSSVIPSRAELEASYAEVAAQYPKGDPPRPPHWGGFCVQPDEIEFWQQGHHRLHDRLRYRRRGATWILERLSP